jgi:hypothetical protein
MEVCPADVLEDLLCIFITGRVDFCLFSSVPPNCRLWVLDIFFDRGNSKPFIEWVSEGEDSESRASTQERWIGGVLDSNWMTTTGDIQIADGYKLIF